MSATRSPSRPAPATEASADPRPSLLIVGPGDPPGSSPGLAEVIERIAWACCVAHGLEAARTEVLLVGQGSARDPASRRMTFHNARRLAVTGSFESVACAFLEEVPLAAEVIPALAAGGPPVVVVGLFAGEGQHGGEELLRMVAERRVANGAVANPRPVYYAGPIGADPEIAGLILNLAEAALGAAG